MALTPMLAPIIMIGIVIATLGDAILMIITHLPKLLKIALQIFNPEAFIRDLLFGVFTGIGLVISTLGDLIKGIIETIFNTIFGQSNGGFFGQEKQKDPKTGKYHKPKDRVCKRPPSIFYYIILILCPPFYVFLKKGLSGWIYILITTALTMLFYFPGLIYAVITCPFCN